MAYQAAEKEQRKNVDTYIQSAFPLTFLLVTTACFDFLAVMDSVDDNFTMCSLQHQSKLKDFTMGSDPCSFMVFYLIALIGVVCGVVVYLSYERMVKFRKVIAIDGL